MTIIDLCKAFDEAEKASRTHLVTSELCRAERVARDKLSAEVRKLMSRAVSPIAADGLAYFSAWAIMRGGFKP